MRYHRHNSPPAWTIRSHDASGGTLAEPMERGLRSATEPGVALNSQLDHAESPRPARTAIALSLIACSLIVSGWLFWQATQQGVGLAGDSLDYVAASRHFEAGHGLLTLDGKRKTMPLTQFPPGYPVFLAWTKVLDGRDVILRARWIHLVLHVLIILLVAGLCFRATGSPLSAAAAAVLLAATPVLLLATTMLLSEALYLCLVLLGLLCLRECLTSRRAVRWSVLTACFFAAAALTRYVGCFLPLFAVIAVIGLSKHAHRSKTVACFILLTAGLGPAMIWNWRNSRLSGQATSRVPAFHPPRPEELLDGLHSAGRWLAQWDPPWSLVLGAIAIVVLGVMVTGARNEPVNRRLRLMLLLYTVCHVGCLLLARTFFDANIRLRPRLIAPVFPALVVIAVSAGGILLRRIPHRRAISIAVVLALAWISAPRTVDWVQRTEARGQGYATPRWRNSPTLQIVRSAPPSHVIYSDGYDVIYLLTGRHVFRVPKMSLQVQDQPSPYADLQIHSMIDRLLATDGWVVLFDKVAGDQYLMQSQALRQHAELIPVPQTRPKDGEVYRIGRVLPEE